MYVYAYKHNRDMLYALEWIIKIAECLKLLINQIMFY